LGTNHTYLRILKLIICTAAKGDHMFFLKRVSSMEFDSYGSYYLGHISVIIFKPSDGDPEVGVQ
jgi:hypothetical protein